MADEKSDSIDEKMAHSPQKSTLSRWTSRLFSQNIPCGRAEYAAIVLSILAIFPILFLPGLMWFGTGISVYDYGTGIPTEAEKTALVVYGTLQILCLILAATMLALLLITVSRRLLDAEESRWWMVTLLCPPMPISTLFILALFGVLRAGKIEHS